MKTLQACYEIEFNKIDFIERKQKIISQKTIVSGAPKCGKSYLIYDYLSNFKNEDYLYINMDDIRNNREEIKNNLIEFINQNSIKILVLENFLFDIKLPKIEYIIISTTKQVKIDGFENLLVNPLDFEEYLLFDNKNQNVTNSFNQLFKYGNLPIKLNQDEQKKIIFLQELATNFCNTQTNLEIFKVLVESIDEKKSLLQLFTTLKNRIKISKDNFYTVSKEYENSNIFHFIKKHNQPKATKKIYCYNHSFYSAFSYTKKFKQEFTNIVFLELFYKFSKIFYLETIDFYIPQEKIAIFAIPFFNTSHIQIVKKRVKKEQKETQIEKIIIITVANSQTLLLENQEIEVIPFYEWALS